MPDTQQFPIAEIVAVDIERGRVRAECPYAVKGTRGHTHWIELDRCKQIEGFIFLVKAFCNPIENRYYRVDLEQAN